jgi:hypothetical protein
MVNGETETETETETGPGTETESGVGRAPFRNLLTHGFLVDEQGRKFSKSLGNGLSLEEVLKLTSGNVDVVRLWACSSDWSRDMKVLFFLGKELYFKYFGWVRKKKIEG